MKYIFILFYFVCISGIGCKTSEGLQIDYRTILPINADSSINMIVEIPSGTTAKYEMDKTKYTLVMDSIEGKPRFIDYLGYPGNYGMIPNTILLKENGGDGDPLDILLLGASVPRGSVQKVDLIGVLELLDNGEQDDKLIAVQPNSKWASVHSIKDLEQNYPGVKSIIETFFQHYKGNDEMQVIGWSEKSKAQQILKSAIAHPVKTPD